VDTVSQAYFALHKTLHKVQEFLEEKFFVPKVTSETFLSISQKLNVTGPHVSHKRNFNLVDETLIFQGHLNVFLELVHGFAVLQYTV
jgi:hypothetical protein